MRTRIDIITVLLAITLAAPAVAAAEQAAALHAAGNGPWVALAVIALLRALVCLGHGSFLEEDDRAF